MSQTRSALEAYGGTLLVEQGRSLVALVDPGGTIVERNPALARLLAATPEVRDLSTLLASESLESWRLLLAQAREGHRAGPATLHLKSKAAELPHSYQFHAHAVDGHLVIVAEPLEALDQRTAEEYLRLTNDLACTTRSLQKASHELQQKQLLLEASLARLEQMARTDELTGLLNRRSIMGHLHDEILRARRYGVPVAVVLIDIDHFKQINDRYGHPAGDDVLRACAATLLGSLRATDALGRYGGEEFLVVLPMTELAAAAVLAERLRRRVEGEAVTLGGTVIFSLTISCGIAALDAQHDTAELLMHNADKALYRAKQAGRNRFEIWGR